MKIAIYGAGSLGTILGAYITKGGLEVDLVNRNKEHVAGLKKNGAHVTGTVDFTVPVSAKLPAEMKGKYDIIFLMTKQLENEKVVKGLVPFLARDGVICTAQNGLPEVPIAGIIGADRTYGCVIEWGATMLGSGVCELTSAPDSLEFGLGSVDNKKTGMIEEIKKILELMGPVEIEENFMGARWAKLIINCAFSGMSSVLGCTFGQVAAGKKSKLCALRIFKECIDVAHASGVKIEPLHGKDIVKLFYYNSWFKEKIALAILPLAARKHKLLRASMLQDLEKGKKCEIEAINGIVSACSAKYGIETPYNDMVVEIVRKIEKGELKPGPGNIRFFEDLGQVMDSRFI